MKATIAGAVWLPIITFLFAFGSCDKRPPFGPPSGQQNNANTPNPPYPTNTGGNPRPTVDTSAAESFGGLNLYIALPADTALLSGYIRSYGDKTFTARWKQLSGPTNAHIDTPDSMQTIVRNLAEGRYIFELHGKNRYGESKDSAWVFVYKPAPQTKSLIFEKVVWSCHWGCETVIEDFNTKIPTGNFRIYMSDGTAGPWEEVLPSKTKWHDSLQTRTFYYGKGNRMLLWNNAKDLPTLKVIYE